MPFEFKIEKKFETEFKDYFKDKNLKIYTINLLWEKEAFDLAIVAVDWASRAVFLYSIFNWLKMKVKEGKSPRFEFSFEDKKIKTFEDFEEIEENLKKAGILKN